MTAKPSSGAMERLRVAMHWLGRVGAAFIILFLADLVLEAVAPHSGLATIVEIALIVTGIWLVVRVLRMVARQAVWRLRNRLLVTYLFIAAVPILLIVMRAVSGGEFLARQLAVYLVTSELDRRVDGLVSAGQSVAQTEPAARAAVIERMVNLFYRANYPGIELLLRDSGSEFRYPDANPIPAPRDGWQPTHGILQRDRQFYLWSYTKTPTGDVTITAPMTPQFLAGLMPSLGTVDFGVSRTRRVAGTPSIRLPEPVNRYDTEFDWFATVPIADWDKPGSSGNGLLVVWSRVSAVLGTVFNRKADFVQGSVVIVLVIGVIVFFIVEIVSVVIGITMTRTITGAVHRLYEGTQKVIVGDFSHRIDVTGKDQLADLSRSFNSMTANIERLLVVAKEKERLQSEIEIAREVQSQLYPRVVPQVRQLRLAAICQPARMVSGDYYDYEIVRESQIALAIGDVAGKGISAALLMATLQSSLRTQLQNWLEVAAVAGAVSVAPPVSTSQLVGRLNNQLYAYTSPEKYATFCLGVFDEKNSVFTYTNAGHLPPILVRNGVARRLDVNGTVVGAFPFSKYDESRVDLKPGDLLVCFTDGVTEPENEYGEMFGEDRLVDLVEKNVYRSEEQIIELVLSSVRQWTATEELQDDMTILLARHV